LIGLISLLVTLITCNSDLFRFFASVFVWLCYWRFTAQDIAGLVAAHPSPGFFCTVVRF